MYTHASITNFFSNRDIKKEQGEMAMDKKKCNEVLSLPPLGW